ncbi:MAG TPA: hypothetical protein VF412_09045 [Bdellovibrio sp.]|uniref:hypothetical protein n=1 Tax=Bdellovibrio sp. TaxID=28201 RepID=UPI002EE3990C
MKRRLLGTAAIALSLFNVTTAHAAVTLMDKDDWKVTMGGFVETDYVHDSTRSFTEIIGNAGVARSGTMAGDNGRTFFSGRNSRLNFSVYAPETNGWKSKGVMEFDFFGYDPQPQGPTGGANSETAFSQNPGPRIRHMYMSTESNGWQILTGQTWSLFGWQPYYFPTTITLAPGPGELFQRNLQFMVMKSMMLGDSNKLQVAGSLERPVQRDSSLPTLNVGARWSFDGLKTAYTGTYGDTKLESLSVGVTGKFTQFTTGTASSTSTSNTNGTAISVDTLIPIIPASDAKDPGNSLTITGEFTAGKGYADTLPNWSGGLSSFSAGSAPGATAAGNTNLDAGYGGFDGSGNFQLLNLQTWNVSLQYVLPTSWSTYMTAGYMEVQASNVGDFANATNWGTGSANTLISKDSMYFINAIHDFTSQVRVGLEYSKQTTHYYGDGEEPKNDRYQITALFRF